MVITGYRYHCSTDTDITHRMQSMLQWPSQVNARREYSCPRGLDKRANRVRSRMEPGPKKQLYCKLGKHNENGGGDVTALTEPVFELALL